MVDYSPFSGGLIIAPKNYSTHRIQADIEDDIEDRADQRRPSNAGLDHSEHVIYYGINRITDISDEDDA
jgi:hypothetical protein